MEVEDLSPALQERLGVQATAGLLALFEQAREEWDGDVITVDRFERRMSEESATMQVALARGESGLRRELEALRGELRRDNQAVETRLHEAFAGLRTELHHEIRQEVGGLRRDFHQEIGGLRHDFQQAFGNLRQEVGSLRQEVGGLRQDQLASRFELVKWSFVFWVGQVVAIAGIFGLMLRFARV